PAGGIVRKLRAAQALTDAGGHGVFARGAVPPGTPHPFVIVDEVGGPVAYGHGGPVYEDYVVPVTVEDEQEGDVVAVGRAIALSDAVDAALAGGDLAVDGYRTWRVWREVGRSRTVTQADGVSAIAVVWRYRVRVSKV